MADEENTAAVINSHDKLFREIFSDKEKACSVVSQGLSGQVFKLVDLDTLDISKDSFIEKDLAAYHSDRLYKVNLID